MLIISARCSEVFFNIFRTFANVRIRHWKFCLCAPKNLLSNKKQSSKVISKLRSKSKSLHRCRGSILFYSKNPSEQLLFWPKTPPKKVQKRGGINCPQSIWDFFWVVKTFQVPVAEKGGKCSARALHYMTVGDTTSVGCSCVVFGWVFVGLRTCCEPVSCVICKVSNRSQELAFNWWTLWLLLFRP